MWVTVTTQQRTHPLRLVNARTSVSPHHGASPRAGWAAVHALALARSEPIGTPAPLSAPWYVPETLEMSETNV